MQGFVFFPWTSKVTPCRIISTLCRMQSKTNRPPAGPPGEGFFLVMFFFSRRLNFTCRSFNFQSARSNTPACRVGEDQLRVAVTHWLTSHNKQSRKRQQRQVPDQNASSSLLTQPPGSNPTLSPPFPPPPCSPTPSSHVPLSFHCGHFGSVVVVAMPTGFFPTPLMTVAWWGEGLGEQRVGVGGGGGANLHRHQQTPPSPIIMA